MSSQDSMSELAQNIVILLICVAALIFLGLKFYKSFTEKGCGTGCGACGAIDFEKMEKQIKADLK